MGSYSLFFYQEDRLIDRSVVDAASDKDVQITGRDILRSGLLSQEIEIWQQGRYIGVCRVPIEGRLTPLRPNLRIISAADPQS